MDSLLSSHSHRRLNALTGEWVLVSPGRAERPWQGQTEPHAATLRSSYDPACYLCPGNARAGGVRNPDYKSTFVFENDFAALRPDAPGLKVDEAGLIIAQGEKGSCRVVCFSPDHSLTLASMPVAAIRQVIETWDEQYRELAAIEHIRHVQIFENRGEMMGASNPHPHCQIWASESIPNEPEKEDQQQRAYARARGGCLLCDYLSIERRIGERMVWENDHFSVLVPFWAVWPFETLVISRAHSGALPDFDDAARNALAEMLQRITSIYDRVFETPFPYSMGFHQRATIADPLPHVHFHAHYYPPLLRSATVRKFMVGFEMLGSPQRDITPESAAGRLRELAG